MRMVFDLDGVIRDLNGYLMHLHGGDYPTEWNFTYGNGKSIFECVADDLDILVNAPPTAYCAVMKGHYSCPEIWTSQPDAWRANTTRWINDHIGTDCTIHFLSGEEKEERLRADEELLLVEDSPNFKSYDRIVLIDRPYNQKVKNAVRIYGTKHLNNMIELIKTLD